jgi:hypothetical protein
MREWEGEGRGMRIGTSNKWNKIEVKETDNGYEKEIFLPSIFDELCTSL